MITGLTIENYKALTGAYELQIKPLTILIGKDSSCSPNEHTDDYCAAYKIAYELQWGRMWLQYDCSSGECK